MYKACSRCGKIHDSNYKCTKGIIYKQTEESKLRNTYDWHSKAEQIKKDSNYLCAICKLEGRYTYKDLEVHHIDKIKDKPDRLLDNYNLICLCVNHHKMADRGELKKERLFQLAKEREDKEL